ncbi:9023_t:CDS:10 [Cetraspora pellucida]|uniref:9023_t:CDS:1 n=1 Tax=Cetraspora pellucida TaxID=1433469 RepID=A0ACA9L6S4_9GLOM|nr:9023_t:CDS:10 [Cetraspora pellucida]
MSSKRRRSLADDTLDFSKNSNLTNVSNKRVNKKQRKKNDLEIYNVAQRLKGFRKELPIWRGSLHFLCRSYISSYHYFLNFCLLKERKKLVQAVKENETIIVMGEMGCGKSTQIPQFLLDAGLASDGAIALTQPRRVASISLAKRVANEVGTKLGHRVIIKYLTDGMLLRELLSDPLLLKYCIIILDEAHERTMRTDILFGMVKKVQDARKIDKSCSPLKVIIMSATLNSQKFANYFNTTAILQIPGRQFPVSVNYNFVPQPDYLDAAFTTSMQIHTNQPPGDILVFLPGQEDIEILEKLITEYNTTLPPDKLKIIPCLLFAALPTEQQTKVFDPSPPETRKIILATNIAETSITINGVRYVVDTGKCKMKIFNSRVGMESLSIENVSKDSADQRMGRAGREAPGFCYRLYTEEEYNKMEKNTEPEIKRCNLASIILLLKAFGIDNVLEFDYLDVPSRNLLKRALEQLFILKALNNHGKITDLGRKMSEFPLEPAYARVLIMSEQMSCTREVINIVSILSVDSIFFSPQDQRDHALDMKKKFISPLGDLITYLNVLRSYETHKGDLDWCKQNFVNKRNMKHVISVRKQLIQLCTRMKISPTSTCCENYEILLKCVLNGFFRNSAMLQPGNNGYKTVGSNQIVNIHPSSTLFNKKIETVMYTELVLTSKPYMKNVSVIQSDWLVGISSNLLE